MPGALPSSESRSSDRGKLTVVSAGGVATGNGTDESMLDGTLASSAGGSAKGICIGGGIFCGGEAARRGEGWDGDEENHERFASAAFWAARDCGCDWTTSAAAARNGSLCSGAAGLDDVTGSDTDGAALGTGMGIVAVEEGEGERRLGADAEAAVWTSASFSLPFERESEPNQDEARLVGGETDAGNVTDWEPSAELSAVVARDVDVWSDSTSGITGISCGRGSFVDGRSLRAERAGLEGPATGAVALNASILSRTLPVVAEISAPATMQDSLGSVPELKALSFLILRELGGLQTLGRGDLVDAVLRMEAVLGWRERR